MSIVSIIIGTFVKSDSIHSIIKKLLILLCFIFLLIVLVSIMASVNGRGVKINFK